MVFEVAAPDSGNAMNLSHLYHQLNQRIQTIDFNALYPGFRPCPFALYTESECFYDGNYIDKSPQFIGNTTIEFEGQHIAIWYVLHSMDDKDQLAASIIHEMFHAYQNSQHETRYPNEMKALVEYQYHEKNLTLKLQEANIMKELSHKYNHQKFDDLLTMRVFRYHHFPYEVDYEARIEQIEGTAHYVELKALEQLNMDVAKNKWLELFEKISNPKHYFPIRVISYSIGAALLKCCEHCTSLSFSFSKIPFSIELIKDVTSKSMEIDDDSTISELIASYHQETKQIIEKSLKKNECVLKGTFPLISLNIYNARYDQGYATSTYFVAYMDQGESKVLNGDFVIKLEQMTIKEVYRQ